jgi:ferredoxin
MMRSVLIIGSGPAAAGAALACTQDRDVQVTVLDIGAKLENKNEHARLRMAASSPDHWDPKDLSTLSRLPADSRVRGLPEKRTFGSDFPFRDFGQRQGLRTLGPVNDAVVSGAYGGFSSVWGAQIMPFTHATFRTWPVSADEMYSHYGSILRHIPYAAERDDLSRILPLIESPAQLPPPSQRSRLVLSRYERYRGRLNRRGVFLGRARLAFKAAECIRCGLCMTGCPYLLIYSASQTMDQLRRRGHIVYHDGLLAVGLEESAEQATVTMKELITGRIRRFTADRIFLACGGVGTSRLVMGSLKLFETAVVVQESAQFMLPFLSAIPAGDPREASDFTLNQFNMVISLDSDGFDVSQLHFYTYNSAFLEALPAILRGRWARPAREQILRRLCVTLGYLPSWASPGFVLRVHAPHEPETLPAVTLDSRCRELRENRMLWTVLRRVTTSAAYLDLWPVLPALKIPARGKSYHWGGTFPHSERPVGRFSSDTLGRVVPWRRIHLVDASVFPSVPATTFTLTVMANAHRIAESALRQFD